MFTPIFITALSKIAKRWKHPKCPGTDEWIHKMWSNHTMKYYSALQKNKIWTHATTGMNLEDPLSDISQSEKDKCSMILLIWGN